MNHGRCMPVTDSDSERVILKAGRKRAEVVVIGDLTVSAFAESALTVRVCLHSIVSH